MLLSATEWQGKVTSVNRRVVGSSPTCGSIGKNRTSSVSTLIRLQSLAM